MSNIQNKLTSLNETKQQFRHVLTTNGVNMSGVPFRDYPSRLNNMKVLRYDINNQNLTTTEKNNALVNLGIDDLRTTVESRLYKTVKTISDTSYTLLASDNDKILNFTSASPITVIIPTGLVANSRFEGRQMNTGVITFVTEGTTLRKCANENAKTAERYSAFAIDWLSTNEYLIYGRLEQI